MTLRLRLVLALVAFTTLAQVLFLGGSYAIYRNSQLVHLQDQLRATEPAVDEQLDQIAGTSADATGGSSGSATGHVPFKFGAGSGPPGEPPAGAIGGPTSVVPAGTVAELRSPSGKILAHIVEDSSRAQPALPATLPPTNTTGRYFTVPATTGSSTFRVFEVQTDEHDITVVAFPTTEVDHSLRRLVSIEAATLAALLVVLSLGAWLILRHGLRPLERMARTAAAISAGDLSQRVQPAGGASEVGQLGLAVNTMLGDIEDAFRDKEETEARLRQFLADASHELRTPLTSIQGFAELFRLGGEKAQVDLPTILRRIEQESARMRALVEDLLLLARLDAQRIPERRPVDLAVLAADSCADAVAADRTRPVSLDAPDAVVVEGDVDHLRQALANLVSNAVTHTAPGTPIEVRVRRDDREAAITVRDHGPGLDDEALHHVFDRFWQGDKARVGAGAGLGLSIVAAIATEHGGRAEVTNAEGGGAAFTLRMPIAAGRSELASAT